MDKWVMRGMTAVILSVAAMAASAGQTPGVASPWNGPWGGGYLNGGPYSALANPYVSAGYPLAQAYPNNQPAAPQMQYLPGGGYILPPGDGGGMLPNAYSR
ncbi:MAG: hypothetical protein ABL868_09770 [Sulfuriferula sp.]